MYSVRLQLLKSCLNPCSNGICSVSAPYRQRNSINFKSLNPCSNGICSVRTSVFDVHHGLARLNPCSNGICSVRHGSAAMVLEPTLS